MIRNGESVWVWANSVVSFQQITRSDLLERTNEGHTITVYRTKLLLCVKASVFS
jgi:hypothetical protein